MLPALIRTRWVVVAVTLLLEAVLGVAICRLPLAVDSTEVLGVLFILLCGSPLAAGIIRGRWDIGEPILYSCAYLALSIGLRGFLIREDGSNLVSQAVLRGNMDFESLIRYAYVISSAGMMALLWGYYGPWGSDLGARIPLVRTSWSRSKVLCSVMVAAVGGFIGFALLTRSMGGSVEAVISRLHDVSTQQGGMQFFYYPLLWCWIGGLLISWVFLWKSRASGSARVMVVVYLTLACLLYLTTGSKWLVFTTVVCLMLAYHYLRRRVRAVLMAAVIVGFVAAWPVFYSYQSIQGDMTHFGSAMDAYVAEGWFALPIRRSYGMDSLVLVLDRVQGLHDLSLGATLSDVLYFFVPRALWPDKPVSFSREFAQEFMGHTGYAQATFVSPSLFGELFLNWHVLGVVGGMFVFGVVQKTSYSYLMRDPSNPVSVLVHAVNLLFFMHLVEGSISAQLATWLSWFIPIVCLLLLLRADGAPAVVVSQDCGGRHL